MTSNTNFINTDMASLIRLHNLGLIDDKAFTEAVKKLNTVGSPLSGHHQQPLFLVLTLIMLMCPLFSVQVVVVMI